MTGIYRADDIRGKFGKDFTYEEAKKIGYAINKYVKRKKIILGYDNRVSSLKIKKAIISELDKEVIDLGLVPTPIFYFVMNSYKNDYGLMITASHLPKEFNGIKLNKGNWSLTYRTGINKIEKLTQTYVNKLHTSKLIKKDFIKKYYDFILPKLKLHRQLKVAVDGGNGVAGTYLIKALRKLNCKVFPLYCNPDGNYPNHVPNPLINSTLNDLQRIVIKKKADIGLAVDGDGDRIRIVSPKGNIIENEVIISLLSKYLLLKEPNSNVVYSSICSDLIKYYVSKYKGHSVMEKVGHSYMKNTAIRKKAILWGEYTGHIGFRENYYNDDGIYAGLKLCELLSIYPGFWGEAEQLSKLFFAPPETRIKIDENDKKKIMRYLFKKFYKLKQSRVDGLRLYFGKYNWVLIRPSNTEAIMSLRFQAKNKSELNLIKKLILPELKNARKS